MRILYGVTGEGLGHAMRARALSEHLVARGHHVKLAASGRAAKLLAADFDDVVTIDGFHLRYRRGALLRAQTISSNLRAAPSAFARNVEVAADSLADFRPDVVLTDFDSFAYLVGRLLDRPILSFDHQHVLDRFRHPDAVRARLSSGFRATRAVVRAKTPGCAHYLVTSFFFPEPRARCASTTTLVGPVIRRRIVDAVPSRGEHVIVYQTSNSDAGLEPALLANRSTPFVVYGSGPPRRTANVEHRPFDEAGFVRDLASARAVIANGGFTTLAEAAYLAKPILSVPVRRQSEQELNAAYVDVLRMGMRARRIDAAVVRAFLDRAGDLPVQRDARLGTGRDDERDRARDGGDRDEVAGAHRSRAYRRLRDRADLPPRLRKEPHHAVEEQPLARARRAADVSPGRLAEDGCGGSRSARYRARRAIPLIERRLMQI